MFAHSHRTPRSYYSGHELGRAAPGHDVILGNSEVTEERIPISCVRYCNRAAEPECEARERSASGLRLAAAPLDRETDPSVFRDGVCNLGMRIFIGSPDLVRRESAQPPLPPEVAAQRPALIRADLPQSRQLRQLSPGERKQAAMSGGVPLLVGMAGFSRLYFAKTTV